MELVCTVDLEHHLGYGLHGSFKYAEPPKSIIQEQRKGFTVSIKNTGEKIENIKAGTILRTALLKAGLTPHNGQAKTVNCKGIGSCGTCAVKITEGNVAPKERGLKENVRLNMPPAFSVVEQTEYEGT